MARLIESLGLRGRVGKRAERQNPTEVVGNAKLLKCRAGNPLEGSNINVDPDALGRVFREESPTVGSQS
jgi:hypothetical protein